VQIAVDAVRAASVSHAFTGVDPSGAAAIMRTTGNPDCHVILRGGRHAPNYEAEQVAKVLERLAAAGIEQRVVVDASHDNSGKDPARQRQVAADIAKQVGAGSAAIVGVMLESFLVAGRQDLGSGELTYGQSITDACMDWETTAEVLDELSTGVRARRGRS
jgi:3-deoxy-7-phosphoheptulonate synthase